MTKAHASDLTRGKALCSTIEAGLSKRITITSELLGLGCPVTAINDALVLAVSKGKDVYQTPSSNPYSVIPSKLRIANSGRFETCLDIQDDQLVLVELILNHGADVDYGDGAALKAAIEDDACLILKSMMKSSPSSRTIGDIFSYARSLSKDEESKHNTYSILLSPQAAKPSELDDALIDLASQGSQHQELWHLLLSKNASVNYHDGAAIKMTIKMRNFEFLPALLARQPSQDVLKRCFIVAMNEVPKVRLRPAKMLLEAGTCGTVLDDALDKAVKEQDPDLINIILRYHKCLGAKAADAVSSTAISGNAAQLSLLLNHTTDRAIASKALGAMTSQHTVKNLPTGLGCASLLLDKGVEQRCLDKALALYVETAGCGPSGEAYITGLLDHGANVNAFDWQCIQIAAAYRHHRLFLQLISYSATSATLTGAVPLLFLSGMAEEDLVETIHACFARREKPDVIESGVKDLMTYLSLERYPSGPTILQTLLMYGYSLDWRRAIDVAPEIGKEVGNALSWALLPDQESRITFDVLRIIIEAKGMTSHLVVFPMQYLT